MSKIGRIDGVGTRRNASGTEVVNLHERAQFCRLFIYVDDGGSQTTFSKGDALALEYRSGSGYQITKEGVATNAIEEFGFGNVAVQLITTDELEKFACGVMAETITVGVGEYAIAKVQVAGKFEEANVVTATAIGKSLGASATAGRLDDTAGDQIAQMKLAVCLEAAASNKADIYLLDPFNLAE